MVEAWLANKELERLEKYLNRGRPFAELPLEELQVRWVALVRSWAEDILGSDTREREDIEAELRYRRVAPPADLVKDAVDATSVPPIEDVRNDPLSGHIAGMPKPTHGPANGSQGLRDCRQLLCKVACKSGSLNETVFDGLVFGCRQAHIGAMTILQTRGTYFDQTDFSVVVKNRASRPKSWRWEIYRAGRNSPIECSSVLYKTMSAANQAGKEALKQLLTEVPA